MNIYQNNNRGIYLIELLIAISIILGIVFGISTYQGLFIKQHIKLHANSFITLINMAQVISLTTKEPTIICPSMDYKNCHKDWNQAIILKQQDKIFKIIAPAKKFSIQFGSFQNGNLITIDPNGLTYNNGHLNYYNYKHKNLANLIINKSLNCSLTYRF